MAAFQGKGILYYRVGDKGWVETYWLTSGSMGDGAIDLNLINVDRMSLLAIDAQCIGGVVYDVGNPRSRIAVPVVISVKLGTFVTGTPFSDDPDVCVQYKFLGSSGRTATRWLRSPPSTVVFSDYAYHTVTQWEDNFALFKTTCLAKARMRHVAPGPVITYEPVSNVINEKKGVNRKTGRPFGLPVGRRMIG